MDPPGVTLRKVLDEGYWYYNEFAEKIGYTPKHLNQVLHGKARISPQMALEIERVLGTPASHWMILQVHYDLEQLRRAS